MDVFDFFGEDEPEVRYNVTTWQYGSATRVACPPGTWATIEEAQEAAREWTGEPLTFSKKDIDLDDYAGIAYENKLDLVVIGRVERDMIVSSAPLAPGWKPPVGFKAPSGA